MSMNRFLILIFISTLGFGCRSRAPILPSNASSSPAAIFGKFQTQYEMNQEAETEFQKTDKQLQKICGEIRSTLDAEGRKKFDVAQSAWINYRKAEAESYADLYRGGSIWPLIYATSLTDSTENRIKELQIELDDIKRR
jgi:uncharacterized protein YecT (DUF1311 family)